MIKFKDYNINYKGDSEKLKSEIVKEIKEFTKISEDELFSAYRRVLAEKRKFERLADNAKTDETIEKYTVRADAKETVLAYLEANILYVLADIELPYFLRAKEALDYW